MKEVQLSQGHKSIVCDCHYDKVMKRSWHYHPDGYARSNKLEQMHRYITDAPKGMEVDHINRDRLDNRCSNLRIVPYYQNRQRSESSGVQQSKTGRWYASIKRGGVRYSLGGYSTKSLAIARVRTAAEEYHQFGTVTK